MPTVLASQTFSDAGGTMQKTDGNMTVSLNVPQGAFTVPEQITVTTGTSASVTKLVNGLPTQSVVTVLGVNFSGAAPTQPVTVTITNPSIPADGVVYKLTQSGELVPLHAYVSAGKMVVSFSSDPDFVILNVKTNERVITLAGHASIVPAVVGNDGGTQTTYMPIWYVMQLLNTLGIKSTWNGHDWHLNTSLTLNLVNIKAGTGSTSIYLNGTLVQRVNTKAEIDPSTNRATTYMPIWYVQQMLNRLGLTSTWNGTTWTVTQ